MGLLPSLLCSLHPATPTANMQMQNSVLELQEMVEAQIKSLENQLKSKKPGRKHMRSHYGSSLTKFLISAVMRKNYKEFVSWVGRAGRTFWKQVQNGNIESELVDADGNELSASARSKLLKDLQEIAAVMVLVPRLESVCSWIQSNIDHVPAIRLSGLFQRYPPREWGALALVSVPGATAASVGGLGGGDLSAHLSSALTVGGHGSAPGGQLTALVPGSGTDAVAMDKANGLEHAANATSTARPSPAPGGGRVRSTGHRRSVSWDLVTARRRPSTSYRPVRYDPEEAKRQREEQERREKEILERRSTCITPGCYWDGVVFPDEKLCVKCVHRQHGL